MPVLSAGTVARLQSLTEDLAFHDQCAVLRDVSPGVDEFGNALPPVPTTVAAGPCSLKPLGQQARGEERVIADRLGWQVPMLIDLPVDTIAIPSDRIRVNGSRTFEVGGLVLPGFLATKATAVVEERG